MKSTRRSAWSLLLLVGSLSAAPTSLFHRKPAPGAILRTPTAVDWLPDGRIADFPHPKAADGIEIVQITPQKLAIGPVQEVRVRIRYHLVASPQGILTLGFNVGSSTTFRLLQSRWIKAGHGEVEFVTSIEPVRWADGRPLKAYVNLSTGAHPTKRSSLASHVVAVKLK